MGHFFYDFFFFSDEVTKVTEIESEVGMYVTVTDDRMAEQ